MCHRVRSRRSRFYVLFVIPIAIDGLTQLVGWRESNWWLRTETLRGCLALPRYGLPIPTSKEAMEDVLEEELLPRHSPTP